MTATGSLLAGAALLALATPLRACPKAEPVADLDPAVVRGLVDWIDARTDYDTARTRDDPPAFLACVAGDEILYEGERIVVDDTLRAAYGAPRRRVYLVEPWSPARPEDLARLLHELIHDVQFLNADWPCPQAAEEEAYQLTAAWMEERGMTPDFDWFEVWRLSRCPRDVHP